MKRIDWSIKFIDGFHHVIEVTRTDEGTSEFCSAYFSDWAEAEVYLVMKRARTEKEGKYAS